MLPINQIHSSPIIEEETIQPQRKKQKLDHNPMPLNWGILGRIVSTLNIDTQRNFLSVATSAQSALAPYSLSKNDSYCILTKICELRDKVDSHHLWWLNRIKWLNINSGDGKPGYIHSWYAKYYSNEMYKNTPRIDSISIKIDGEYANVYGFVKGLDNIQNLLEQVSKVQSEKIKYINFHFFPVSNDFQDNLSLRGLPKIDLFIKNSICKLFPQLKSIELGMKFLIASESDSLIDCLHSYSEHKNFIINIFNQLNAKNIQLDLNFSCFCTTAEIDVGTALEEYDESISSLGQKACHNLIDQCIQDLTSTLKSKGWKGNCIQKED
jgi:hypothetical protein